MDWELVIGVVVFSAIVLLIWPQWWSDNIGWGKKGGKGKGGPGGSGGGARPPPRAGG